MRKFVLFIVLFFCIVAILDIVFGKACEKLLISAKGGSMKEIYQTAQYQTADVVILGSSRAHHHYVPSVFFDSLGITAHNGGVDGNGIVLAKGLYQMITERYHPSLLIYDVNPGFDFFVNSEDGNNIRYLGNLRPYSRKPSIRNLMDRIDPMEKYKNISAMFRFNSKILDLVKDQFWAGSFRNDGYAPQFGELKEASSTINEEFYPIDSLKLELFEEFVSQIKNDNIKLIVVFSPKRGAASSAAFTPVREICERNNVELWDYYSNLQFQKNAYFKDNVHLNDYGAKIFTSVIANRLMEIIE